MASSDRGAFALTSELQAEWEVFRTVISAMMKALMMTQDTDWHIALCLNDPQSCAAVLFASVSFRFAFSFFPFF